MWKYILNRFFKIEGDKSKHRLHTLRYEDLCK